MNEPESGEEYKYKNPNKKTKFIFNFNHSLNTFDLHLFVCFLVLCIFMWHLNLNDHLMAAVPDFPDFLQFDGAHASDSNVYHLP